jgi:protein FRA10AC1
VLSGAGENTCGNTRCKHHTNQDATVQLNTLELPFAYEEHGEHKSALVKVVLCPRCLKKLMWKRNKEKGVQPATLEGPVEPSNQDVSDEANEMDRLRHLIARDNRRESVVAETYSSTRRRSSRSRSPRHRRDVHRSRGRRSRSPQA